MQHFVREIIARLAEAQVEFVVVGGISAVLQGASIVTVDLDICYRRTPENIKHLATALAPLQPRLRGLPPDLTFQFDERALLFGTNFTLEVGDEWFDLLGEMSAIGGYEQIIGEAREVSVAGHKVKVLSLAQLIATKEAAGRPKDLAVMPVLKAALELQQKQELQSHTASPFPERLEAAYQTALSALLAERTPDGHWVGELSTSALATATAVSALALVQKHSPTPVSYDDLISGGVAWLVAHQNEDGGWGDTVKSISNISTSMLCRAAFHLTGRADKYAENLRRVESYLQQKCGHTPEEQAEAIRARYGKDRTFAVPILTTCALAGLVSWKEVVPLPFELACFPQSWFRFLRLPVVSYALPALIAIGQAVYHHRPPRNPVTRLIRRLAIRRSLRVLETIQPSSGGFLEATPLTSFVTLSLAACGLAEHPVTRKAVEFLVRSVRPDGSWPIDTNLATWVTTLAIDGQAAADALEELDRKDQVREWLLGQQYKERHPYTGADPGGWAWTDLPGGVPDGDDTPGALLALSNLDHESMPVREPSTSPVFSGLNWLYWLHNKDGGWPTFCRGWGHLPFDRSGPDLTAHALRAFCAWIYHWFGYVPNCEDSYLEFEKTQDYSRPRTTTEDRSIWWFHAIQDGFAYLTKTQRPDGSWLPLWFGNQFAPNDENPTYGTARVLAAYRDLGMMNEEPARRGVAWLLSVQNADGGWGGAKGVPSSVEETALAVEVLLDAPGETPGADAPGSLDAPGSPGSPLERAVNKGLAWLVEEVERGGLYNPTPIGFYFAKLWYFEKLYPMIFTVAALGRARRKRDGQRNTGG